MIPFDSLPSKPLPFAATLQPIDQNADASKLPKPKRRPEQFPQKYPLPAYAHSRHSSFDVRELGFVLDQPAADVVGSDEWMKKRVNECVDSAKGELHIKWVARSQKRAHSQRTWADDSFDGDCWIAKPRHAPSFLFPASAPASNPSHRLSGSAHIAIVGSAANVARTSRCEFAVVFKDQLGSRVLSVLHFHPRGRTGVAGGPETE
jgi:hypothetical protein